MTRNLIAILKAAQDEGGIVVMQEGEKHVADALNAGLIVKIEREYDEPCDDPCVGCSLHGSFSTDALICCASCPKAM